MNLPQDFLNELPSIVKAELLKMPEEKIELFVEEYKRKKKSLVVAYIFWLLFGLHYA